jgi:hypothetical protein
MSPKTMNRSVEISGRGPGVVDDRSWNMRAIHHRARSCDLSRDELAQVEVGEALVGVALVDHDRLLVVADSNRFGLGSVANLAVVSTGAAPLTLPGFIRAGEFPRDMAVSRDGKTLIVGNYGSGQVEEVVVATLS